MTTQHLANSAYGACKRVENNICRSWTFEWSPAALFSSLTPSLPPSLALPYRWVTISMLMYLFWPRPPSRRPKKAAFLKLVSLSLQKRRWALVGSSTKLRVLVEARYTSCLRLSIVDIMLECRPFEAFLNPSFLLTTVHKSCLSALALIPHTLSWRCVRVSASVRGGSCGERLCVQIGVLTFMTSNNIIGLWLSRMKDWKW